MRSRRKAMLTFEWILLITILVIGIVSGLAVIRDATIIESGEVADAILHHNKSYYIRSPVEGEVIVKSGIGDMEIAVVASKGGGTMYVDLGSTADGGNVEFLKGE